jgi:hypothetical protein
MLEPDRDQPEIFVDACFRHAGDKGFVAVRSFYEGGDKPFRISTAKLSGGLKFLIDVAEDDARRAAQNPKPVVFCPPLAVFAGQDRAREEDIVLGLTLSVECDAHPNEARAKLEALLGTTTMTVKSGGRWINGGDAPEDKRHLHWRLARPARGKDQLAKLKRARELAAHLVGGDPSNAPICHPIRWAGSWHRKSEPRLCEIEQVNPDVEVELDDALAALTAAAPATATKAADIGAQVAASSWDTIVADIISGRSYHASAVSLAARLVGAGLHDGQSVNLLRSIMQAVVAPHDERWQTRYHAIPGIVNSAREKYAADQSQSTAGGLDEWDAGDDPGPIEPRHWLLGNQFCRTFISSVVAAGGTGKTALRLLQFISLATGRPLCGQHVFRRCRVLLISLEDDTDELQRRIKAVLDHCNIPRSELLGWLFCATPKLAKIAVMNGHTRVLGPLGQQIKEAVARRKPDLISLDPFVKTHSLEENDSGDMDFVCDLLAKMAVEFNVAIDAPHHVHKGQVKPGDADSGRGSSGIRDAGRLVYTLCSMSEDEAATFSISNEDRQAYVRLDPAKVNIAARSATAEWFRLVGVPIGNGTSEYPNGDTIQVAEPWAPPSAWDGTTSATLNAILTEIDKGLTDENGKLTGQRYSNAPKAKDRAVWPVVQRHYPDKTEGACREIIHAWLKNEVLYPKEYDDPVERKKRNGLVLNATKRPS